MLRIALPFLKTSNHLIQTLIKVTFTFCAIYQTYNMHQGIKLRTALKSTLTGYFAVGAQETEKLAKTKWSFVRHHVCYIVFKF